MIILYGNRINVISSLQESLEKNYSNGSALIKWNTDKYHLNVGTDKSIKTQIGEWLIKRST